MSNTIHIVMPSKAITKKNANDFLFQHLIVPNTIESISMEAYLRKAQLRSVEFSTSVTNIGARAFKDCSHLETVRYLGSNAFHGCNRLKYIEITHDPEFIGESLVNKPVIIRCKKGSKVDDYCRTYECQTEYINS